MTILVTGGTGHLGANLVRALLACGQQVRVLVRAQSNRAALKGLDVELVVGDLRDPESLRAAVRGTRQLYHTAAMISTRSGAREALIETNVLGTRALMQAALDEKLEKVVHTSSFGAVGARKDRPSTEEDLLDPFEPVMEYERSKAQAEIVVFQAAARGLPVTIVNPSAIIGPYDFGPSLVGKTVVDFGRGRMHAYIPGGFDWVPMRDVVRGHLAAMERGRPGERYLLNGQVHSLDEIVDWLAEFTGRPRPYLRIPPALMRGVAIVKDYVERRFFPEVTPRFNYHAIRLLTSGKCGSNEKARRELGYQPTSVRDAFAEAVCWFQENGWF